MLVVNGLKGVDQISVDSRRVTLFSVEDSAFLTRNGAYPFGWKREEGTKESGDHQTLVLNVGTRP